MVKPIRYCFKILILVNIITLVLSKKLDYGNALSKSILFFEGQRSGKLPPTQRMIWRKDSALGDGLNNGVDLTGGYYDAGDNVKFNFPMAFSTTMLAWAVLEYGKSMGTDELPHALDAIRWSTDYFLKATSVSGVVFVQVGDPNTDHVCWQRPEDMTTPRTVYVVNRTAPGSEVTAEIAAALAASSLVFRAFGDKDYSKLLLLRASKVFQFANKYRGSYNDAIGNGVCPFYCDYSGYYDELLWAAAWLHKATRNPSYWNYVAQNIENFKPKIEDAMLEFGWDAKHAGLNILVSKYVLSNSLEDSTPFISYVDKFVCSVLPESPTRNLDYTPGGLLFRPGGCNIQNTVARSFILLLYARYLKKTNKIIHCNNVDITQRRLVLFAKSQVDYILGDNPLNMSYMVGYGETFPQRIHHRASSSPSIDQHPQEIECKAGFSYLWSESPNPNILIGAVVGGPDLDDSFEDSRLNAGQSEPTTYVNAPLVGLLAYFKQSSK